MYFDDVPAPAEPDEVAEEEVTEEEEVADELPPEEDAD